MTEKLQLLVEGLTEGSEYFLDGITIREVLPTGELGPNFVTVTDDSEGWEFNEQLEPTEGNGSCVAISAKEARERRDKWVEKKAKDRT